MKKTETFCDACGAKMVSFEKGFLIGGTCELVTVKPGDDYPGYFTEHYDICWDCSEKIRSMLNQACRTGLKEKA